MAGKPHARDRDCVADAWQVPGGGKQASNEAGYAGVGEAVC